MHQAKLIVVTGLPASGKSTLARLLSQRYSAALLMKDSIKEPLLDLLGAEHAAQSRRLSDASFAVMFGLGREMLAAGTSLVLEGNFRPGEHERALQSLFRHAGRVAQVLCRIDEAERIKRLAARASDPTRHPGHRDADLADAAARRASQRTTDSASEAALPATRHDFQSSEPAIALASSDFLSIQCDRFLYDGDATLDVLDHWWHG